MHVTSGEELSAEIPDADILVGIHLRPAQFQLARRLQWIHSTAAGVAQLIYPELRDSGVVITNASGVHAIPMAEHVVGMMMALAHDFPGAMRHQLRSHWATAGNVGRPGAPARAGRERGADRRLWRRRTRRRRTPAPFRRHGVGRHPLRKGRPGAGRARLSRRGAGCRASRRGFRRAGGAGNPRNAPPDRRAAAGLDEAVRISDQCRPRIAAG